LEPGLYVVSTPIGNLKDITIRALEILKEADFVVCEDTRTSGILLKHYDISKEMQSLNAVNESHKSGIIINRLLKGESCALISDAGTPGISDPGVRLISQAIRNNIKVIPVPGVTAAIAALTLSGLPTDSFVFEGFIPQKKGRQKMLQQLSEEKRTIIIYESVYRIRKLLEELNTFMPDRLVVICRELTKKFEESRRGYPAELLLSFTNEINKGEFVIVIAPKDWTERHHEVQSSDS